MGEKKRDMRDVKVPSAHPLSQSASVRPSHNPAWLQDAASASPLPQVRKSVKDAPSDDLDMDENLCVICDDKKRNHTCLPCGHTCFCKNCLDTSAKDLMVCPICRD